MKVNLGSTVSHDCLVQLFVITFEERVLVFVVVVFKGLALHGPLELTGFQEGLIGFTILSVVQVENIVV